MTPDPKPPRRIVDPLALDTARRLGRACVACGGEPGSVHHLIPRSEGGDDVPGNLIVLCGSGAHGCHGAFHGNPYMILGGTSRRTSEWVRGRIGAYLLQSRPDALAYIRSKFGPVRGNDYLLRVYQADAAALRAKD